MKFKEQQELVEDLRALADFYERPESIALPRPWLSFTEFINEYEYNDDGKYVQNFEKSKAKLKRIVRALGACEKDWGTDNLTVLKKIGSIRLRFQVNREVICEKKVVGVEKVPKRRYVEVPGEYDEVEQVEWVCNEVSLLS